MPLLADTLYEHLLDRFPADRDYPRGALYADGMPPLVAGLLGRTLDRWLEHEIDGLESRWFDFDDPAVRAARSEFVVALGRTARVPRGAWSETLRYAVGLVVRHLSTPARALTDATFEGEEEALPTDTVRRRLHTFEAYGYLPEIADAYLEQKAPDTVDPDTLHGLLLRIDRRVTAEYEVEDWLRLLGPLFKTARYVPELRGVHASLLTHFFEAKGLDSVADSLRDRGEAVVDEAALREVLIRAEVRSESATSREDEASVEALSSAQSEEADAVTEVAVVEAGETDAYEIGEDDRPAEPTDDDESTTDERFATRQEDDFDHEDIVEVEVVDDGEADSEFDYLEDPEPIVIPHGLEDEENEVQPLWKRFANQQGGPTMETSVPRTSEIPKQSESAQNESDERGEPDEDDDAPLWKRVITKFRGPDDTEAEVATETDRDLDSLESRVLGRSSPRLRSRYVRDLFDGDVSSYHHVLGQLDQSTSWSDASRVIAREVFRKYQVDIYSDTAVDFTDSVQKQLDR